MGLTHSSSGFNTLKNDFYVKKRNNNDIVVALAGNPNVGKSTVFNALTGLNQHTGNWSGKTISNTQGYFCSGKNSYVVVDIPGTYSLLSHSKEEEIARNYICFGKPDITVVLCDATCIERNLNLAIQILEITKNVIICVNFLDEAKRKGINIDLKLLEKRLGVKVIGITARKKRSLKTLIEAIDSFKANTENDFKVEYPDVLACGVTVLQENISKIIPECPFPAWICHRLISADNAIIKQINKYYGIDLYNDNDIKKALSFSELLIKGEENRVGDVSEIITASIYRAAEKILKGAVTYSKSEYTVFDRRLDKIFTGKITGFPIMLLLLALVFWITLVGANYLSEILSDAFLWVENHLRELLISSNLPKFAVNVLCDGVWHVLSWVISVMLPPMTIFFPLFAILEDSGYLPRVAFNLDKPFKRCSACGKQALTMCMGFGCNAAGVVGARIIDSKRERILAILTNSFVPCNGRFPMMMVIISIFFVGNNSSVFSAMMLSVLIIFGILMTFFITDILSKTVLKGTPSSFTLELPPYRKPQFFKTILHSITDRTLFALGRAAAVAAPAGLIIWFAANINFGGVSILSYCAHFLDPLGKLMGLDGIILMAFILGFPANEIVVPLAIMAYSSENIISGTDTLIMENILISNGWDVKTAICFLVFALFHWPCSTTMLTIKKETGSFKWTFLAFIIPTMIGITLCSIINFIFYIISL